MLRRPCNSVGHLLAGKDGQLVGDYASVSLSATPEALWPALIDSAHLPEHEFEQGPPLQVLRWSYAILLRT